jgi:GTP-binding protein YchF
MIIDTELILKDIETVEKRVEKFRRTAKSGDKEAKRVVEVGEALQAHLESEQPARSFETSEEGQEVVDELMLLTAKPILYVCNVDIDSIDSGNAHTEAFRQAVADEQAEVILISAGIEADIAELDTAEERAEFIEEMGLSEPGVNKVIRASYELLDLVTYFTAGEKEVRAWTIKRGTKAPGAAGVIHTDFEKGFIRAEVIHYADYVEYGSEAAARDNGKLNIEGKEYVVQDGDVMHFRFNV